MEKTNTIKEKWSRPAYRATCVKFNGDGSWDILVPPYRPGDVYNPLKELKELSLFRFTEPKTTKPIAEWQLPFDWQMWFSGCESPEACNRLEPVKMDNGEIELHHRRTAHENLVGAYWQCPHCSLMQLIRNTAECNRIDDYKLIHKKDKDVYVITMSNDVKFMIVMTYCTKRAYYMRDNDHPIPLPTILETCIINRLRYKFTKGCWSGKSPETDCD